MATKSKKTSDNMESKATASKKTTGAATKVKSDTVAITKSAKVSIEEVKTTVVDTKPAAKKSATKIGPAKKAETKAVEPIEVKEEPKAEKPAPKKTTAKKTEAKAVEPVEVKEEPKAEKFAPKKATANKTPVKKAEETEKEVHVPTPKPTQRYSDEELEEFNKVIVESREEALDELRMLNERLEDLKNFDFAEESMIYSMHMAEQGSELIEKEKLYAQVNRIKEYIKKLDDALVRIKDKTYGLCRVCGILIAKERLLAVPITTLSASYKIHQKCPEDGIDRIEPIKNKTNSEE